MSEIEPAASSPSPKITPGQALFGAIMDDFSARSQPLQRSMVVLAVKQGAAALKDGISPEIVFIGCVTALRRGRPELTARVIHDISMASFGEFMNTHQYNRELQRIASESDPGLSAIRKAMDQIDERKR